MAAEDMKHQDLVSEARKDTESARSPREKISDLIARVRRELEHRADAGASLSELDSLLVPHKRNPRLSVDQYDALWLYAWALLHRPGRAWGARDGWYDTVEPG
jgi:hypothetical protein